MKRIGIGKGLDKRSKLSNNDSGDASPGVGRRRSLQYTKEDIPLLTVPKSMLPLDLSDGNAWSEGSSKGLQKAVSSDTFVMKRQMSGESPSVPWDQERLLLPFQDLKDLLYTDLVEAVVSDDVEALLKYDSGIHGRLADKVLLLACREGANNIVNYLIKAGVSAHCRDLLSRFDALSTAVYFDNGAVVTSLLEGDLVSALPRVELNGVTISLLHLAAFYGCNSALLALCNCNKFDLDIEDPDSLLWKPLHYAVGQGNLEAVEILLSHNANPNAEGPFVIPYLSWGILAEQNKNRTSSGSVLCSINACSVDVMELLFCSVKSSVPFVDEVRPLHAGAYREWLSIVDKLLQSGADPRKIVSLNPPKFSRYYELMDLEHRKLCALPLVVSYNSKIYSTLLHWAVVKGTPELVEKMLSLGSSIDVLDLQGRTPLGMALIEGRKDIISCFSKKGIKLSDEDKNWRRILDEESGLQVVNILETTNLDALSCCNKEGFSLLHLAASKGYLSLLTKLLNRGVTPNLETVMGETPLFFAVQNNHQACVQQLIKSGCDVCHISHRNSSVLHSGAKFNNFAAIDMILNTVSTQKKVLDINLADENDFTAIYYAINASRYDIVQRFIQFCVAESIHVKATKEETLLQFYTEKNTLGQYDNAIVRVLELEQELHASKFSAEKCLRLQLGTTEASTKAREQLEAMYESTQLQRHCWNFWIVISCFFMPSILYFLDVYTDVVLAVEYYNDYIELSMNETGSLQRKGLQIIFENITESQSKINLMLTVFFILFPMTLLSIWSLYVHLTQRDILPPIKRLHTCQRAVIYIMLFIFPIGPIVTYIENSYAQIKYMNVTAEESEKSLDTPSILSYSENEKMKKESMTSIRMRDQYNLKNVAQMRVAINNVLEATLESAFQLILQLYILGTQYKDLKQIQLGDVTLGSILSLTPTDDSQSRLSKQVLSVLISLVSLTWSFTGYHRFSKLGGLRILWSLPLLFAIFFQIISRAIACTVFTLAYTWRIFIVLGVHYVAVLLLKALFESRTEIPPRSAIFRYGIFAILRPYFYVILGAFTSTFVYFRIQRPLSDKDQLSRRHSSFVIQILFLLLALVENVLLFGVGVAHLDPSDFDNVFKIIAGVLCLTSFIIGIILQWVYYGCFGHPWVNINGPSVERGPEGTLLVSFYKEGGKIQWVVRSCRDCQRQFVEQKDNVYMPKIIIRRKEARNWAKGEAGQPNGSI